MIPTSANLTILQRIATIALAAFINGLIIWQFLPNEVVIENRALLVALVMMLLQLALLVQSRARFNKLVHLLVAMLVCQTAVLAISWLTGPVTDYGLWKLQGFIMFAIIPTVFILLNYWQQPDLMKYFFRMLFIFSLMSLLIPIINPIMFEPELFRYALKEMKIDVIGMERNIVLGILIAGIFFQRLNWWHRMGIILLTLPLLLMTVLIEERGPILALLLAILYFYSRDADNRHVWNKFISLGSVAFFGFVMLFGLKLYLPRFSISLLDDGRWSIIADAFSQFWENPWLGTGLGAFSQGYSTIHSRTYFHNIFGEVLTETGIIGLCLMLTLMLLPFAINPIRIKYLSKEIQFWFHASVAVFIYAFVNANVSGDLTTNYLVWISYGMIHCFGYKPCYISTNRSPSTLIWKNNQRCE